MLRAGASTGCMSVQARSRSKGGQLATAGQDIQKER